MDHLNREFFRELFTRKEFLQVPQNDSSDMPSASPEKVTELLTNWRRGNGTALDQLTPLVYEDLRRLAHHYISGQRPDHTLQATALVNEAFLRLADQTDPNWQDRAHFFAVAARAKGGSDQGRTPRL